MRICRIVLGSLLLAGLWTPASAESLIEDLSGEWAGKGTARRTADSNPVDVNCRFTSTADAANFHIDGSCRAFAIFRQQISANLTTPDGSTYQGVYVGPEGGQSALSGTAAGNVIELQVAWAEEVNGDNAARMQLEVAGPGSMVLRTIDESPTSGDRVVTSEIALTRQ